MTLSSSKFVAYPPPETPASWPAVSARPLLPIDPPAAHTLRTRPSLPCPLRKPIFTGTASRDFDLSTHIIPACYLRTTPYLPEFPTLGPNSTKQDRQKWATNVCERLMSAPMENGRQGYEQPSVLWNVANRYSRKGSTEGRGVTLFFSHATGFPKEIWEPTINHLLNSSSAQFVDEIWTWESIQHGDACLLNKGNMGCNFDWSDNARDILNFLLHFLPSSPSSSTLPTHLDRVSPSETENRRSNGFRHRQLLCAGHSYGGCSATLAAVKHPKIFSSLILIDPIIVKPEVPLSERTRSHVARLVMGALTRRDTWPSREAALEALSKSPFFGAWDKDVLRAYIEGGTYVTGVNGVEVSLKTSGLQEGVVFAEPHTRAEVYPLIPTLDENIKLRWLMPGTPGAPGSEEFGPPGAARKRVWLRPNNTENFRVMGAGHLIPQEKPDLLAEYLTALLDEHYKPKEVCRSML